LDQKKIGGASPGKSNKILSEKKKKLFKKLFFLLFWFRATKFVNIPSAKNP
jgi:hypothetical protein